MNTVRILGRRPGAVVFADGGLYAWQQTQAQMKGIADCSKVEDPDLDPPQKPASPNERDLIVKGASMKRLDETGEVVVIGFDNVGNSVDYENSITLEAIVGPYLFIEVSSSDDSCGAAHRNQSNQMVVFRLGDNARVSIPSERDLLPLRQRALALNRRNLQACVDANRPTMDPPGPDSLDEYGIDRLTPRWTPAHGLQFHLDFLYWRNFVTGNRGCETDVDLVPEALRSYPPPAALSALVRQVPDFKVYGWSTVPPRDAARIPVVTRVFESAESDDAGKP